MKSLAIAAILLFGLISAYGQNEQSPIVEKDISYKNWSLKDVRTGEVRDLRQMTVGKKLVIVVYFAPWCGNWKHDVPFLQRFYDKYKAAGLEIIGVGEYDPVDRMKLNLETYKVTFPVVYESENRTEKQNTKHYGYRHSTGDDRNWGSPWYIFLEPSRFEKKGDTLVKKTHVINGEMIETEGEKFIRERLGLPATEPKATTAKADSVEVCDPAKPAKLNISGTKKP